MINPKPKRARSVVAAAMKSRRQSTTCKRKPATLEPKAAAASAPAERQAATTKLEGQPTVAKGPSGKLGVIVALMRRPEGATVSEMGAATGWQAHSIRGALAGSLKRKHKLAIVGQTGEDGRTYRIMSEPVA